MKKLLFSAVALVAFSSVSMGNTIELKNDLEIDILKNQSLEQIEAIESPSSCVQFARNAVLTAAAEYDLDISREGDDFDVMMEMYMLIYTDCLNN